MNSREVSLKRANHVLSAMGVNTAEAKVMDRTHYVTFDAKGKGSIVELLDSNTKKLVGTTTFDANKFNKGRFFIPDEIRVVVEGTATKVGEATWNSDADKAVVNSEIALSQDEEILTLPVSDLLTKLGGGNDNQGFRVISSAPVLVPEKEIKLRWTFPNGVGVDNSTVQFVRVEMRGIEFFIG